MVFNRYFMLGKVTNMNIYGLSYRLPIKTKISYDQDMDIFIKGEYLNQRYFGQQDQVSLIGKVKYVFFTKLYVNAEVGISQHGKMQFLVGALLNRFSNIPFNTSVEVGYYLNRLRYKTEISRTFLRWGFALGYEKFYKYNNAYVSLRIPLEKFNSGFVYRNFLKRK